MPSLTVFHYIFICLSVFIAGFIDAIAGGGGLITMPAYLLIGLPSHSIIGTNKLSSSMGTIVSTADNRNLCLHTQDNRKYKAALQSTRLLAQQKSST